MFWVKSFLSEPVSRTWQPTVINVLLAKTKERVFCQGYLMYQKATVEGRKTRNKEIIEIHSLIFWARKNDTSSLTLISAQWRAPEKAQRLSPFDRYKGRNRVIVRRRFAVTLAWRMPRFPMGWQWRFECAPLVVTFYSAFIRRFWNGQKLLWPPFCGFNNGRGRGSRGEWKLSY